MELPFCFRLAAGTAVTVLALGSDAALSGGKLGELSGYGFWQAGQIVEGEDGSISKQWINSALLGLRVDARPMSRLRLTFSPEVKIYYPLPEMTSQPSSKRANVSANIAEMSGTVLLGDTGKPVVELGAGVFPYKYNPQARDLGEYLFRTGTYPLFVINEFDFAQARLCGFKARVNPLQGLSLDMLFTTEMQFNPLHDFSLSFLARYRAFNVIDVGLGAVAARLVPVNPGKTSPTPKGSPNLRSDKALYYKEDGDSGYYSFKGLKTMARLTLDPKGLFPGLGFFGKEDLKLYGEVMALDLFGGYKTKPDSLHPAYYDDLSRRMPLVIGFNLPAFKVLDVLAFEFEYFPSRLPNDYRTVLVEDLPLPEVRPDSYDPRDYTGHETAWAVYAKKEVLKGLSISGQIAYDHLRLTIQDGTYAAKECLYKRGEWYWMAKIGYSF